MDLVVCGADRGVVDPLVDLLGGLDHTVVATCRRPDLLATVMMAVDADVCILTTSLLHGHQLDVVAAVHRQSPHTGLLLLTDVADDPLWAALDAGIIGSLGRSRAAAEALDAGIHNSFPGTAHVLGFRRGGLAVATGSRRLSVVRNPPPGD